MNLHISYLDHNGDNVGMILPEDSGFQEAKDLLSNNFTRSINIRLAGSTIQWIMQKVDTRYILKGTRS